MILTSSDYQEAETQFASVMRSCTAITAPNVLEAGGGSLSHVPLPSGARITVIDITREQLERNEYAHVKVLGDLHTYEFPTESFDIIVCWNVLEHLEDPARVVDSFMRWLRPGGLLVIAAPNPRSLQGLITKYTPHRFHVWALKHLLGIKTAGQPGKGPFPTFMDLAMYPQVLARTLEQRGFEIVHLRCYSSIRLQHLHEQRPLVGMGFSVAMGALKVASLGRWNPEHSDFHLIAQKPG